MSISRSQARRLLARAETAHGKYCDIASEIEQALGEDSEAADLAYGPVTSGIELLRLLKALTAHPTPGEAPGL